MNTLSNYIHVKEAAELLGVCGDTLRRWDKAGKLQSVRHPINQYRLYNREQIEKLVAQAQS